MKIEGYKAFNKDYTNRYGLLFKKSQEYLSCGPLEFGILSNNGFHMCKYLADVFRYFDSDNCVVAKVLGSGNYKEYNDEYYGYYDMYVVEKIKIVKFLTRREIIDTIYQDNIFNIIKFLKTFKLNNQEKLNFLKIYEDNIEIIKHLLYYQFGQKDIFLINDNEIIKNRVRSKKYG